MTAMILSDKMPRRVGFVNWGVIHKKKNLLKKLLKNLLKNFLRFVTL